MSKHKETITKWRENPWIKKNKIRKGKKERKKERKNERKKERTKERKKERKERKKERKKKVTFSWKMKGKLPSLDPPTRFYFLAGSPCYLLFFFFSQASSLFIWIHLILIDIHRDLCLCTSFLVRIAGGGTPPPAFFFNRFPLLPTILFVFHKHHRLFGFILSLLISIEICAYVLLLGTHCWGRRCALPPAPPPPAFIS